MQADASKVNDKTQLRTELKKIASDKGFRIADNEGSGNCMFYALSDQLEIAMRIKIKYDELRQALVQYLRKNPKLPNGTNLFHFTHGHQSWADYLTYMEQDGAWGDHVILYAAANCYKTCIHVVSSLSTAADVILQPQCTVDKSKPLVLGHIHELHYVSLHSTQGNTTNKKRKAPHSSNLYTVKKRKSQVSEQASDRVPDAAAWLQTYDSALSTLERTNTQPMPLPATETSDNKGGVPIESKGWNSLHSAAEGGNEGIIEILLSCGLDIDSRGNDGITPLMVAAAAGKEETVNFLLSKGADPHLKNYIGRNLLHAAAEGGNTSIVERMLSYGIDIDSRDDECNSATSLIIAAKGNNVEVMKYLLQKGANLSLTTGSTKRNALHIASQCGSVAAIEMLLSCGLSLDSRDGEGNMPLAHAAACGQIEAVNCLLEHGADPLLKGKHGWNLLHFAAQSGNVTIIDTMLSKGLDIDSRGETLGLTPLLVSLKFGKLEAANHLLGKGANEFLALAFAAASNSVAAIAMLLSHGLSINSRDAEGDTPLFYAARCGSTEALNYLVEQGADPLLQNNSEFGLLHLAALSNNVATIEAVLSKNFDINIRTSSLGITPLFVSLWKGNLEAANYLLERGADEHLKSEEGWTVLSVAASGGNVAVIEMLLNRGHNPNSRDGCDRTPSMYAAEKGNKAAVEYLLPLTH